MNDNRVPPLIQSDSGIVSTHIGTDLENATSDNYVFRIEDSRR